MMWTTKLLATLLLGIMLITTTDGLKLPTAAQHVMTSQEPVKVPGNATAVYNGDPSNFILDISQLELRFNMHDPNPGMFNWFIQLNGTVRENIGSLPMCNLTLYYQKSPNSEMHKGPSDYSKLLNQDSDDRFHIIQDGVEAWDPPHKGPLAMTDWGEYGVHILTEGYYTVRVQMYGTDTSVITDWQITKYLPGWCPDPDPWGPHEECKWKWSIEE